MNILKKLWCRAFQTGFRIALPFLPYRTPEILRAVDEVPAVLKKEGADSVLLVTDQFIRGMGLTVKLEQALADAGIACAVYDGTIANPTTDNVEAAKALYRERHCQALIAFGGGSSIDCAKAVGALIAYPGRTVAQLTGNLKVHRRLPPLIAVPTTAGTGSETTLAAVITDAETHHKQPMNAFPLIPKYAVLDPEVTRSLPANVTATTGMDALTHAVEAYIGQSTTAGTRAHAIEAAQLIFANVERAYADGNDMDARAKMSRAAFLAGDAFTKSYVGYVHAVAHSLGGFYNIPHGLANAVLLPIVLEAYGSCAAKKLHELSVAVGLSTADESNAAGAEKFIAAVRGMNRRMGIPETLTGIREEDVPKLARFADHEGNPLYPVPCLWDAAQLERFYYLVMAQTQTTAHAA
jgi:alcohol dehydrogenase